MPTINKRFLLKLLLVVALLAGAIAGIHTVQARRIPNAILRQADRAVEADKPDKAIKYLRQYLEFQPDDVDVQVRLADLLRERSGDAARAELVFLYDKILRSDSARLAVRREAIIACLQLKRFTDAAAHAEALLAETPGDAAGWRYLARAQVGQRQFDAARKSFETAVERDPKELLGYQQLAEFHWLDRDKPQDARAAYDRMTAALPSASEAWYSRAKFLARSGGANAAIPDAKDDPVLNDLKKALELSPKNADASLLLGERLQRHRDVLAARSAFQDGLKHNPDDERLVRSLAWLEVNRGNSAGAIRVLEEAVERSKDGFELLVPLADLLLQAGDVKRTRDVIEQIERRRGRNVKQRAGYLRGRLAMQGQDWDAAIATLTEVRSEAVELPALETQANLLLATCFARRGESAKAIECLQLVTLKEPGNIAARAALAQAHLDAGQIPEAIREYGAAANQSNDAPALARAFVQLQAMRLALGGATDDAWKELERAAVALANRLGTRIADGGLLLADFADLSGKPRAGMDLLQKALARHSNDVRVWTRLAELVADSQGVAAGLRILDEAQAVVGDGAELRLARADLYARDPARLRPLTNLEGHAENWSEDDQARLLLGLLEVHDRLGNSADVLRLYKKVAARRPRDAGTWLAICERAWAAGDANAAREATAILDTLDEKPAATAALCAAWKNRASGTPSSAIEAFGERPTRADACELVALQHERENRLDKARELYARAVRLEPTRYEPAKAYLGHLASTGADAELKRYAGLLAVDPRWSGDPFRRVVRAAATGLKEPQHVDRLIQTVRPIVERQPGGLGWLADLSLSLGRIRDSLSACELAVAKANATPDDWLRYALRTAESSGRDAGAAVVASAKSRLSPVSFADLATAFTASRIGSGAVIAAAAPRDLRPFAEAKLAILLAQLDRASAIRECESLLANANLSTDDAAWARRRLAMLLTVRGEPSDRKKALGLLAGDRGGSPADRRATASVLASLHRFLDGDDRATATNAAIALLEGLAAEPTREQPRDAFALVQIYQTAGRADEAVQAIQRLLNANPENVEYLLAALGILDSAKQLTEAAPFAARLLALAPNDYRAIAAAARFECARGGFDRAIALADQFERSADLAAGEQTHKTARAAELLDQLSRIPGIAGTPSASRLVDAAVAKYESILHAQPRRLADLAASLAADRRPDRALEIVDRRANAVPDHHRAMAGVAAIRVGGTTDARTAKVRAWIASALAREPASLPLRLAEAECLLFANDLAGAERAYEAILALDDRNAAALNNLAWILAPRSDASARAESLVDRAAKEHGLTGELLDTRARIRIAAKRAELAERDAAEALKQDKTPLRYFHLALAQLDREPEKGRTSFREAKSRGLDANAVHPLDRPLLAKMEKDR